jgi:galactokinase
MSVDQHSIAADFVALYGGPLDIVVRSPGRVNLIGDHTDYNDGFVLPVAIDRYAHIAARVRSDETIVARSGAAEDTVSFDLRDLKPGGPAWGEYLKGVLNAFDYVGPGLDLLIASDVPLGAGLSSSAALELGIARIISLVAGWIWDPIAAARLCQRAENEWVGNACGIMDQLVVANATQDNALLIDCRSLETKSLPLPERAVVVVLDTRTRRRLVTSKYNERRQACARAAVAYGVHALRDVEVDSITDRPVGLSVEDWNRAEHVVFENARVLAAVRAMGSNDLTSVGRLMVESHNSLRDLFEVSTPELDRMVELTLDEPGCFGARMTGAGFGGCAVALFDRSPADTAIPRIAANYRDATGIEPDVYRCRAAAGTSIITSVGIAQPME